MYVIAVEIDFKAGHYLQLPSGKQERPHTHHWLVRVSVEADRLDKYGFVTDFHYLQRLLHKIIDPVRSVDYINDHPDFSGVNPTTECFARYVYDRMTIGLDGPAKLTEVTVWETKGCRASYRGPDNLPAAGTP